MLFAPQEIIAYLGATAFINDFPEATELPWLPIIITSEVTSIPLSMISCSE